MNPLECARGPSRSRHTTSAKRRTICSIDAIQPVRAIVALHWMEVCEVSLLDMLCSLFHRSLQDSNLQFCRVT